MMLITPELARSYKTEYWHRAKPFIGYQLMMTQAAIARQSLHGFSYTFVDKLEDYVADQIEAAGFRLDRSKPNKDHISW